MRTLEVGLARAGLPVILLATIFAIACTYPALPIDETRYLTVAWEMRASGNWLLPTLNFAPYSDKPPLLFWLINSAWSVFGTGVWPARLITFSTLLLSLALTIRLERSLSREPISAEQPGVLLLLAMPFFVVLGLAITFDMLLTVCVLGGLVALWNADSKRSLRVWAVFGISAGLGLLAKGPVVLLHLLPPALLVRYWQDASRPVALGQWYVRLAGALALACLIGLAWAIPAAVQAGPEFARMLFWDQSAGRIALSFAHVRPLWFYIPVILASLVTLLIWRAARDALLVSLKTRDRPQKFLLSWIGPALVALSLISGKQPHYILPLLPGFAILISLGLRRVSARARDVNVPLILTIAFYGALLLAPCMGTAIPNADGFFLDVALGVEPRMVAATLVTAVLILYLFRNSKHQQAVGLALASLLCVASLSFQARGIVYRHYDLQRLADVLAPFAGRSIAVSPRFRGEFGFLARLRRPVVNIHPKGVACWLASHPDGAAVVRLKDGDKPVFTDANTVRLTYWQKYRKREVYQVLEAGLSPRCNETAHAVAGHALQHKLPCHLSGTLSTCSPQRH